MKSEPFEVKGWQCTDVDNLQYVTKTYNNTWMFREFNRMKYPEWFKLIKEQQEEEDEMGLWDQDEYWLEDEINLDNYDEGAMYDHICHYYPWDEFQELLKSSPEVVAECIWEQENGMY